MVTLTDEQERQLAVHAAARYMTPAEALQCLLDQTPPQRRPWSELELAMLREKSNSPRSIANQTGRSITSISNRRHQLAIDENRPDLLRRQRTRKENQP